MMHQDLAMSPSYFVRVAETRHLEGIFSYEDIVMRLPGPIKGMDLKESSPN